MSVIRGAHAACRRSATQFFSVWNLAILLVLLIVVFSLLKRDTFLTAFTFQSMVNSRSINALVALAVMIPLASNNFDLSVGLDPRHLAGAGQRPADPAGPALAGGGARSASCSARWSA